MIRHLFITILAALFWSVQTVDTAVDLKVEPTNVAAVELVSAADPGNAAHQKDPKLGDEASCICHVLHNVYFTEADQLGKPRAVAVQFAVADIAPRPYSIAPPTRPPLA